MEAEPVPCRGTVPGAVAAFVHTVAVTVISWSLARTDVGSLHLRRGNLCLGVVAQACSSMPQNAVHTSLVCHRCCSGTPSRGPRSGFCVLPVVGTSAIVLYSCWFTPAAVRSRKVCYQPCSQHTLSARSHAAVLSPMPPATPAFSHAPVLHPAQCRAASQAVLVCSRIPSTFIPTPPASPCPPYVMCSLQSHATNEGSDNECAVHCC